MVVDHRNSNRGLVAVIHDAGVIACNLEHLVHIGAGLRVDDLSEVERSLDALGRLAHRDGVALGHRRPLGHGFNPKLEHVVVSPFTTLERLGQPEIRRHAFGRRGTVTVRERRDVIGLVLSLIGVTHGSVQLAVVALIGHFHGDGGCGRIVDPAKGNLLTLGRLVFHHSKLVRARFPEGYVAEVCNLYLAGGEGAFNGDMVAAGFDIDRLPLLVLRVHRGQREGEIAIGIRSLDALLHCERRVAREDGGACLVGVHENRVIAHDARIQPTVAVVVHVHGDGLCVPITGRPRPTRTLARIVFDHGEDEGSFSREGQLAKGRFGTAAFLVRARRHGGCRSVFIKTDYGAPIALYQSQREIEAALVRGSYHLLDRG